MTIFRAWLRSLVFLQSITLAEPNLQHANHIFNAIHSSMRQWGSSLNHNGMSAFIATVPAGTQFYHGTSQEGLVRGMEWLAFEPEHALVFARDRARPPPHKAPGEGKPPRGRIDHFASPEHKRASPWSLWAPRSHLPDALPVLEQRNARDLQQVPLEPPVQSGGRSGQRTEGHGYLHTYRTKHELRLLYLDGQSAAKSRLGTLDFQDILLLHDNPPAASHDSHSHVVEPDKDRHHTGPMGEHERASGLCDMVRNEWDSRIDGILRMELGFEVILCSFENHLKAERIAQVTPESRNVASLNYYKAVASRFDGIGGGRVTLDYDNFVTLFASGNAVFFDDKARPRIRNETAKLRPILKSITDMILRKEESPTTDWQAIADMVVARYSDRIEYLASGDIPEFSHFKGMIDDTLRPYLDFGARNATLETERCATAYLPSVLDPDTQAVQAILNITTTICASFQEAGESDKISDGIHILRDLQSWLAWTTWKRCRGCSYAEVCFVPIWPSGGQDEFDNPRCISDMSNTSRGYWGDFGPPPPPPTPMVYNNKPR